MMLRLINMNMIFYSNMYSEALVRNYASGNSSKSVSSLMSRLKEECHFMGGFISLEALKATALIFSHVSNDKIHMIILSFQYPCSVITSVNLFYVDIF